MESSDNKSRVELNHLENVRHVDDYEPHQLTLRSWTVVL